MKKAASKAPTIYDALVEIRDLSVGDAATRKAKRRALRANPARVRLLAAVASLQAHLQGAPGGQSAPFRRHLIPSHHSPLTLPMKAAEEIQLALDTLAISERGRASIPALREMLNYTCLLDGLGRDAIVTLTRYALGSHKNTVLAALQSGRVIMAGGAA
ncbi:hypothetical protein [Prosthecobacter sp.]|uniref:hypothetical protein n=1 Tax=Prosthecobacter sp. TaxID=1965333 RepID=UPI003784BD6B